MTIVDRSGRNLSGQTVEAFWTSVEHARPFAAGVNCSLGATEMRPYVEAMSRVAPVYVICYPNAGLPNAFGGYDEQPPTTSRLLKEFGEARFLNAAGGCCGTGPEHIRQIREAMTEIPGARCLTGSLGRIFPASSRSRSPPTLALWSSANAPTSPGRSASGG